MMSKPSRPGVPSGAGMNDLEEFSEFFRMKGVPFHLDNDPDAADGVCFLYICDAGLQFNSKGEFEGVFNYESGYFHERLPAEDLTRRTGSGHRVHDVSDPEIQDGLKPFCGKDEDL